MARTKRNSPEWAKHVDWFCGSWKVNNFRFSSVRDCKSDRGDGKNYGWNECDTVKGKRFFKRLASKMMRRHSRKLIRNQMED